jgi:aspartokinase/homoserine dehydrogenase 1
MLYEEVTMSSSFNRDPTLVMKFGGTSVGDADAVSRAADIISRTKKDWPRLVVVTSAMSGVTNLLLDSAGHAVRGDMEFVHQAAARLQEKHIRVVDALLVDHGSRDAVKQDISQLVDSFTALCNAVSVLGEATPRVLDAVASLGERLSVRLLAAVVNSREIHARYVEATQLIITDRVFQSAHPNFELTAEATRRVLEPVLAGGEIPIVTGFLAATPEGVTITLGRGGSDYSAAILGAALPADEVWIWTDVDGVMSADPRLVPDAKTIPELSYREIAELAYFGAKVVHPKTIRPVIEAGIGLRVCNTFNPDHPGTFLVADTKANGNGAIKAVTAIRGQSLITIEGRGMLGVPGVAARTFGAVAATGTSVPLITQASSEQSICFALPIESAEGVISALETEFDNELTRRDIDRVWATGEVVIITVVGAGMINTPGIAGRIFGRLGACNVNVIAIAQGSSEVAISLVVTAADAERAVRALHELIVARVK